MKRRDFVLGATALSALCVDQSPLFALQRRDESRVSLGFDGHSMLDPGNSVWVMEDPLQQVQTLGKHVVCTSVRDYMVWESEEAERLVHHL